AKPVEHNLFRPSQAIGSICPRTKSDKIRVSEPRIGLPAEPWLDRAQWSPECNGGRNSANVTYDPVTFGILSGEAGSRQAAQLPGGTLLETGAPLPRTSYHLCEITIKRSPTGVRNYDRARKKLRETLQNYTPGAGRGPESARPPRGGAPGRRGCAGCGRPVDGGTARWLAGPCSGLGRGAGWAYLPCRTPGAPG